MFARAFPSRPAAAMPARYTATTPRPESIPGMPMASRPAGPIARASPKVSSWLTSVSHELDSDAPISEQPSGPSPKLAAAAATVSNALKPRQWVDTNRRPSPVTPVTATRAAQVARASPKHVEPDEPAVLGHPDSLNGGLHSSSSLGCSTHVARWAHADRTPTADWPREALTRVAAGLRRLAEQRITPQHANRSTR
jgi:hypothetical protein